MARTPPNLQILIAGGGIAGLTAAIAFASRGFSVRLFEQAPAFSEIGAGLQLSPNATRILRRLGVLDLLLPAAVRPQAVILRDARSLTELARVPLGAEAEKRWGAPYLTVHRADLQSALLARAGQEPDLRIMTGAKVRDSAAHAHGITISVDRNGNIEEYAGHLLIGADGVWSKLRHRILDGMDNSFTGLTAWRATVRQGGGGFPERLIAPDVVTAFLNRNFHLVTYPLRAGAALNLVAITRGGPLAETWDAGSGAQPLFDAMDKAARPLAEFAANASGWVCWPLHVVDAKGPWTRTEGVALIGDAAHAMTPFAAQGAAMAIEDAEVLAGIVSRHAGELGRALEIYETERRPRVLRVAQRGALNRLAWHAAGPVALVRNLVLRRRSGGRLADDLDWLYGQDATKSSA
ncbi:FAD-binding protein [Nitratireductor mangrovi]|uniref:FAD-binding protein n=1 Tax=Nitratireductor mangrovi TaxID=2599600 RepID=A0A5B8KYZ6_9HYPH|nr:FAD-dependent monooxygenase [Nitratireductor mangrovi]QDZ00964.1 FAD-binding protein [Nitratireductor mangrovi]